MQPLPAGERLRASVILSGGAAGAASDEEELPHHKARADTPIVAASPCVHRTPLALVPSSPGPAVPANLTLRRHGRTARWPPTIGVSARALWCRLRGRHTHGTMPTNLNLPGAAREPGRLWGCLGVCASSVPEVLTKVEAALASASTLRQPAPDSLHFFLRTLSSFPLR